MKQEDINGLSDEFDKLAHALNKKIARASSVNGTPVPLTLEDFHPLIKHMGKLDAAIEFVKTPHGSTLPVDNLRPLEAFLRTAESYNVQFQSYFNGHSLTDPPFAALRQEAKTNLLNSIPAPVLKPTLPKDPAQEARTLGQNLKRHLFSKKLGTDKLCMKWGGVAIGATLVGWGAYKFFHRHKDQQPAAEGAAR